MSKQEEMFRLVEEYRSSGLSAKAFARKFNIAGATFGYWIRKKRSLEQESGFIEVTPGRPSGVMEIELIFPNGIQLRMNGCDPALISKLVQLSYV